ncbi:MAG: FIST C-terminal domain-containing protein [Zoogloeaceae bacterium]|nr:FIST C-terminal domain-containing protein [Zoogloeaceae bacterium]
MSIEVRFGKSLHPDAKEAVRELEAQVGDIAPNALIFFCSPRYDHVALGRAIQSAFDCPAIGCTTAGEILGSEGYIENALVCAAIASDRFTLKPIPIRDLRAFTSEANPRELDALAYLDRQRNFTLLLIDGLSMLEELVVSRVNNALRGVPLIGASAGDGLDFAHARVYHDGAFHENFAVVAVVETSLPFLPIHTQHFEPTEKRLVITEADVATRTVMEINGLPAAEEYANTVGLSLKKLTPQVFAAHPVMLRIGGEYYVRSIQKVNPDGSLRFFCAIDTGLVFTVAKSSTSLIARLEEKLAETRARIPHPALILGSDCILRRLEIRQHGELEKARAVLSQYPFIGFSTYGEQFGGIHVNHTLTALILGDGT